MLKDTNVRVGLLEITYDDLNNEIKRVTKKKNDSRNSEIVSPTTEEGDPSPAEISFDNDDASSLASVAASLASVEDAVPFVNDASSPVVTSADNDDASSSASVAASADNEMGNAIDACLNRNKGGRVQNTVG